MIAPLCSAVPATPITGNATVSRCEQHSKGQRSKPAGPLCSPRAVLLRLVDNRGSILGTTLPRAPAHRDRDHQVGQSHAVHCIPSTDGTPLAHRGLDPGSVAGRPAQAVKTHVPGCLAAGAEYFLDKATEFDQIAKVLEGLVGDAS